jgi:isopenicillin N synthase-like dioxygenase
MSEAAIPRVDLTAICDGDLASPASRRVLELLLDACRKVGFITVTGHGIERPLLDRATAAANAFFSLPEDLKRDVSPRPFNPDGRNSYRGYFPSSVNGKEGLDIGDPRLESHMSELLARPYYEVNHFPDALPESWRHAVTEYFDALSALGVLLMQALTVALGGDPEQIRAAFARPRALTTLRFNLYPVGAPVEISKQDGAALSCETHVDSGFLTILRQGPEAGLQVRDARGHWIDVPFDPEALVVNTGRALQRVSGGVLAATQHRVSLCHERRVSIPFFLEPAHDLAVGPAAIGLPADAASAPSYEQHLRESLSELKEYARDEA